MSPGTFLSEMLTSRRDRLPQPRVTPSVTLGSPHSRARNLKGQERDGSKEFQRNGYWGNRAAYRSGEDADFHSTQVSLLWKQNRSIGSTFPTLLLFLSPSKFSKVVLFTVKLLLKPQACLSSVEQK